jgi:twitching motility protein PilU
MKTFDQALFELYKAGKISKEEAVKNADSRNNVSLQIRLSEGMSNTGAAAGLSIRDEKKDEKKGGVFL